MKLKRNDISLTMAALFCSLLRTFFVFTKTSAVRLLEAEEEVINSRQYRPTSQSLTQIVRGTCCDLGLCISAGLGREELVGMAQLNTDSSPRKLQIPINSKKKNKNKKLLLHKHFVMFFKIYLRVFTNTHRQTCV